MKLVLVISLVISSLGSTFESCGEDQVTTRSGSQPAHVKTLSADESGHFGTITLPKGGAQPEIHPSDEPPSKRLLTRELEVGTGPVARFGDRVAIYYFSVDSELGKRRYFRWPPQKTLNTRLESEQLWHRALVGMRAGGQREAIIPPHIFDPSATLDYFYEMVRVNGRGGQRTNP